MDRPVNRELGRARERLVALDRERGEVRATIATLQSSSGGPDIATAHGRVTLFASLFLGRPDVFATRWESRKQAGRSGGHRSAQTSATRHLREAQGQVCSVRPPRVRAVLGG